VASGPELVRRHWPNRSITVGGRPEAPTVCSDLEGEDYPTIGGGRLRIQALGEHSVKR